MTQRSRTTITKFISSIVFMFLIACTSEGFDEWMQWRGPNRDGITKNLLPGKWPQELTRKWQIKIGSGASSPVVSNGRVYTFTREGEEEVARSIEIASSSVLWRTSYPAPYNVYPGAAEHGSGPRSTPVISQDTLFTFGISGILSAFDARKGTLKWQKKFDQKFPEAAPPFGASMSPLVSGNLLIAFVGGHKGGALIAFDVETGNEKWNLTGDGPSYSSPIIVKLNGTDQIVTQAHRKIMGVDLNTGKLLWSIPFVTPCDQNIVTPLVAGDVLIFSSLDTGTFAVRVQKQGNVWSTQKVWSINDISMYMSSPLYIEGNIIGMSHKKQGQLFAIDAKSGSILWTSTGKIGENAAIIADDQSIVILKDDGELQIISPYTKDFEAIRTYSVSKTSTWAHPVPISSGLLIKDNDSLTLWSYESGVSTAGELSKKSMGTRTSSPQNLIVR